MTMANYHRFVSALFLGACLQQVRAGILGYSPPQAFLEQPQDLSSYTCRAEYIILNTSLGV